MPMWAANLHGIVLFVLAILSIGAIVVSFIMQAMNKAFGEGSKSDNEVLWIARGLAVFFVFGFFYLLYHPTTLWDAWRAFPRPPAVEITR